MSNQQYHPEWHHNNGPRKVLRQCPSCNRIKITSKIKNIKCDHCKEVFNVR